MVISLLLFRIFVILRCILDSRCIRIQINDEVESFIIAIYTQVYTQVRPDAEINLSKD
jgi:hypothetical protein